MSFVQVMMKNYNFPFPWRLYKGQEKQKQVLSVKTSTAQKE